MVVFTHLSHHFFSPSFKLFFPWQKLVLHGNILIFGPSWVERFYQQHLVMKPLGFSASLKCEGFVFIVARDFFLLISAELCHRYQSVQLNNALQSSIQDARLLLGVTESAQMLFLDPDCKAEYVWFHLGNLFAFESCMQTYGAGSISLHLCPSLRVSGGLWMWNTALFPIMPERPGLQSPGV